MFNNLTERLSQSLRKIINKGRLTEENIKDTIREVRKALLEADVTLSVIKKFIQNVSKKAIGHEINKSLTPGQEFIKIVKNELILSMGEKNHDLNLSIQPPAIILVVGLQGVGKTTTLVKLAKWIKEKYKKKILTVSTDIYRAAAIKQLQILSDQVKIDFYLSDTTQTPINITKEAIEHAKLKLYDLLLIDTAGRLHINTEMMNEINTIQNISKPIETLLIVDSMMGQDAINIAKKFSASLSISGIVITKTDSDARSGVALSIRHITGKPIKFIGTGEKLHQLEPFHPERIADRILGMNQVISLIKDIEEKVNQSQVKNLTKKFRKGDDFNLNDFLIQLKEMKNMGNLNYFIEKFSKNKILSNNPLLGENKNTLNRIEAIIYSMTHKERMHPIIIKGSRKRRIALGSGTKIQDVNKLLKNFDNIKKIMKKIKKGGIGKMIRNISNILPKNF
ncbi:signal recognition particle protein [Buchnera aphidicola]|jgi:signal recognition particle subunit SRP54|uniref:Signal recognition particle protein n=1 Tax=Buchnera aphidicola subsp. Schizaphis graminum (strain Sg) TaxID=198804 RepID=SRP54_BUCAP|nr:signal recognition particle protein [Buchnera aphidicola]Q8K9F7.1 RecName: Full=Signal recognition particle protein; AltName: Full=Fifty-four homolog [Buchnera aphidicola str. Sg (Schizaphis graminum)]AAM67932.1 signal recognition particle protein [Buchnera aphidicola str. Sg (Schizaphis graminum)]AWI49575.1 signal recognition particle protein [Buchnera aphidicola (Schizaphis graminum)]